MPKFNTVFTCVGRGGHCTTGVALERDINQYMDAEGEIGQIELQAKLLNYFLGSNKSNINQIVVGPFEEEEEGTGVDSNVVKVQGDDPDTPDYLRGDRVRLGRWRSWIVGASPLARSR